MVTKALLTTILYYVAGAVIYFSCVGRWDLPTPWVFFVCNFLLGVALMLILASKDLTHDTALQGLDLDTATSFGHILLM